MTTQKTLLAAFACGLLACGAVGTAAAQSQITDADGDTRVETNRGGGDDDFIYLRAGGTDRLLLRGARIEPLNNGQSIFLGNGAGQNDNLTTNRNLFIGQLAGQSNVNGQQNTALGYQALRFAPNTSFNTAIGPYSLDALTSGNNNSAIGKFALSAMTSGTSNAAIGPDAGRNMTSGDRNAFIGAEAGLARTGGSDNVAIGYGAGRNSGAGSGNVFIGTQAGRDETGSNKLYIANSETTTPLIKGDFAAEELEITGEVKIDSGTDFSPIELTTSSTSNLITFDNSTGYAGYVGAASSDRDMVLATTGSNTEGEVRIGTRGGSDLNVTTDHLVGIGTLTPDAKLEVSSASSDPQLKLTQTGSSDFARLRFEKSAAPTKYFDIAGAAAGTGSAGDLNFFYFDGTTGRNIMTIEGSQDQVGIGTTNPIDATFVVEKDGSAQRAHIGIFQDNATEPARFEMDNVNGNGANWQIQSRTASSGNTSYWQVVERAAKTDANQEVIFHVDGELNRVGINNENPAADIHIGTSTGASIQFGSYERIEDGGSATIEVNSTFVPGSTSFYNLGTSSLQWNNLYLSGSVLFAPGGGGQSSRAAGGEGFAYGLEEIMALRPAVYDVAQADGSTARKLSIAPASMQEAVSELYVTEVVTAVEDDKSDAPAFAKTALDAPAVNTLDLVPVLVAAMQEQQAEVEDLRAENAELQEQLDQLVAFGTASDEIATMLADMERTKSEIEQLKADLTACCMNAQGGGVVAPTGATGASLVGVLTPESLATPSLEQNAPNPFHNDTQIRYYLPEGQRGELVIFDNLGRELTRTVAEAGVNYFRVEGGSLAEGAYRYSLVVEGAVIDSKQMILTK